MIEKLKSKFREIFNSEVSVISSAPGRVEVLGNHTDYNEGYTLSCAIELYTYVAVGKATDDKIHIYSSTLNDMKTFNIFDIEKKDGEWSDYIKGILCEISKLKKIEGVNILIDSTLPLSSGMSSSAALEISTILSLAKLWNIDLDNDAIARLSQRVENNYLGLKSGLLDQFSSLFGEKNKIILCDFREKKVMETVNISSDYVLVVVNSMVKHNLVNSSYNKRRESCERSILGINKLFPDVRALRDVSSEMLEKSKEYMTEVDYRRAKHIVNEDELVLKAITALKDNDIKKFGSYLYASHESSKINFENSCPELDYLVELSKTVPGCIGARLSGGGFGGISIHLVEKNEAQRYSNRVSTGFRVQTGIEPQTIICEIGDGASVLLK